MEKLYDYNIDDPHRRSPREIIAARLALAMEMDEWCENQYYPMKVLEYSPDIWERLPLTSWHWDSESSIRWNIILSTHYYFNKLLVNAPILTMALAEAQRFWPRQIYSSMLRESIIQVFRDDFESAKNLQKLVRGMHSHGRLFIQEHALWFLCNYSSTFHLCPMPH